MRWKRIFVSTYFRNTLLLLLLFFVLVLFSFERPLHKDLRLLFSNRIGKKFGRTILQVNTHRLTDFWYDVRLTRWRPWRHFTQKSAKCTWRVRSAPVVCGSRPLLHYAAASGGCSRSKQPRHIFILHFVESLWSPRADSYRRRIW